MKTTDTELVRRAIYDVWNTIAYDVNACDNEEAVELCIDANRLAHYGHPEAEQEVDELCRRLGYPDALRWLAARVHLL